MKVIVVVAIALAAFCTSEAEASKKYVKLLPNGGNVPNTPAIGHADGTGEDDATNAFGDAFAEANYAWTKALCEADSDGDGQTNGQELGDPCCEWAVGGTPKWTSGVSNPGNAASTSDSSLWANACGASESTTETSAPTTETSGSPSASTAAPAGSSTQSESESTGDSHDTHASGSTNTTTSANASSSPTTAEKCASDLAASTRALRTRN